MPKPFERVDDPRIRSLSVCVPNGHRTALAREAVKNRRERAPGRSSSEIVWLLLNGQYPRTLQEILDRWQSATVAAENFAEDLD